MGFTIAAWEPGLKTISLMDVLRKNCGMTLTEAKQAVDGLLDGREIVIGDLGEEHESALRKEVESLGGICH